MTGAKRRKAQGRLGVAAAIAILGLAGCADESSPAAGKAQEETAPVRQAVAPTPVQTPFNVRIDALGDTRPEQARLLSVLIRQNMGATPAHDAHEIVGALDAAPVNQGIMAQGLYVVAVLDLKDAGGARLHRVIGDEKIDRPGGGPLTETDIARLADRLAVKLAGWHGVAPMNFALDEALGMRPSDDTVGNTADGMATGSIRHEAAAASKLHFEIAMGPAPGDGAEALAQALASALSRRAPSSDWGCGCYRLQGRVAIASAEGGRTAVTIDWLVATGDGRPMGKVTQTKALAPESVAGHWGELAREAAETAASGVLAVVLPDGRKTASGT